MESDSEALQSRVFERRSGHSSALLWVGAIACLVAAAAGFFAALRANTGPFQLQLMATAPALLGVALAGQALMARSRLLSVAIDNASGVTVTTPARSTTFAWSDIAWNAESLQPVSNVKRCQLFGADGRVLVSIPAFVDDFEDLVRIINRRIKSQPTSTAEAVRRKRLRRQSLLLIGFGVLALIAVCFLTWTMIDDSRRARLLSTVAVDGQATVVRKFVAPDGRTCRIEYRVDATSPDGKPPAVVNVELDPLTWEPVAENGKLPVRYVPADPDVSRLTAGQRDDLMDQTPGQNVLIICAGGLMAVMFLGMGLFNYYGVDVVIDSETKRLRIARGVAK